MASLIAAGTSYATHGEPMIPFYIFYSMFGFQRTGDQFWQLGRPARPRLRARRHRRPHHADRRGAAARRRALAAARLDQPGVRRLRPGVRLRDRAHRPGRPGADVRRRRVRRTAVTSDDVFYYLTDLQRADRAAGRAGRPRRRRRCCAGIYRYSPGARGRRAGRGRSCSRPASAMPWALEAQRLLGEEWGVDADVWSVTSWNELRRDAVECERAQPAATRARSRAVPYVTSRAGRRGRARSSRCRTSCARCPTRSRGGCRATTPRWAPTASASPTPAARPGGSSTSTRSRSWWRCCEQLARRGEVKRRGAARGVRALPARRRQRRRRTAPSAATPEPRTARRRVS